MPQGQDRIQSQAATFYHNNHMLHKIFSVRDVDSHYKFNVLGLRFNIRHKDAAEFPDVAEWGINREPRSVRIVASLTSFPQRIGVVHKAVSCLLSQRMKPDVLILWLAEDQFPRREGDLPESLLRLKDFGLTIRWCENIFSYKKLIPSLREYPDDVVVTFDDDMYYAPDVLENLYSDYLKHPGDVHCYRTGRIRMHGDDPVPVHNKILIDKRYTGASFLNVIMSGTGTLCPPGAFHRDILDESLFMGSMPTNDEIFFWAMAVRNGTRVRCTKNFDYRMYLVPGTQNEHSLSHANRKSGPGIDGRSALKLMVKTYPEILPLLKGEDQDAF